MQNWFYSPPPGTFLFQNEQWYHTWLYHVPLTVAREIENGDWRSVSGVFCDSFDLSFRPSFSIRRWRCSSSYHRPYCRYYGNMCLSRSVCKKAARSMRCHFKSNLFWTEEVLEQGLWEFIVDIFTSYIWNFIPSAFHLVEIYFPCGRCRSKLLFLSGDVGNSVLIWLDPLDKYKCEDKLKKHFDSLEHSRWYHTASCWFQIMFYAYVISPSFWMVAHILVLKRNTCPIVTLLP